MASGNFALDNVSRRLEIIQKYLDTQDGYDFTTIQNYMHDISSARAMLDCIFAGFAANPNTSDLEVATLDSVQITLFHLEHQLQQRINIVAEAFLFNDPVMPLPVVGTSAPQPIAFHPDEAKYQPKSVVVADDQFNQRLAGFPNGCTQYSLHFLGKAKGENYTRASLKELLQAGPDLGIVPGLNAYAADLIQLSPRFALADTQGNRANDSTLVLFTPFEEFADQLRKSLDDLIQSMDRLEGFVVTTGIESFAVRFRTGGDVEFFDPHGDAEQSGPAFIFSFARDEAARKIATLVTDRASNIIQETQQLELFPIIRR